MLVWSRFKGKTGRGKRGIRDKSIDIILRSFVIKGTEN